MRVLIILTYCLCLLPVSPLLSQDYQVIEGLPTKEIYDLHIDKKGYLWVAHDLGISRFDGLKFVHYSTPNQASLSMTDLLEDNEGRIWCHNFSGQVFYIQNNRMVLYTPFLWQRDKQFPRMIISGEELLISSNSGLFVCSTKSLKGKYLKFSNKLGTGVEGIAPTPGGAVVYFDGQWFAYKSVSQTVTPLTSDPSIFYESGGANNLQPISYHDTLFLVSNPSGMLQKLTVDKDGVHKKEELRLYDFINCVTLKNGPWIHCRNRSYSLQTQQEIANLSITDIAEDAEGNTWYSSLKKGLLFQRKQVSWQLINLPLDKGDYIKCLNVFGGYFFAGTQRGNLLTFDKDTGPVTWQYRLNDGLGSVDFVRFFGHDHFVVGASVGVYLVTPKASKAELLLPRSSIKDVDFDPSSFYFAASNGAYLLPYLSPADSLKSWMQKKKKLFPYLPSNFDKTEAILITIGRCRSVRYHPATQSIFISEKDGLYRYDAGGRHPFLAGGKKLYVSSLWYKDSSLFIGTFSDGLWVLRNGMLQHFTTSDFLTSNSILRIKATANFLWIFEKEGIQLLHIKSNKIVRNISLPQLSGPNVYDVAEREGYGYMAAEEGIYKVPLHPVAEKIVPVGYIDYVLVNGKRIVANASRLSYTENDVQFFFSAPFYAHPNSISFKYRLKGVDDDWHITEPNERMIRYASLPSGAYVFEAIVVDRTGAIQKQKLLFSFDITKPWWKQWWFLLLLLLAVGVLVYIGYRVRIRQIMKVEGMRREISRDLHDDIGASLSSVSIYASLVKKKYGEMEYLSLIQQHVGEIIGKIDELIWSVNPRNDSMKSLIQRMKLFAEPMLEASSIGCHFTYEERILLVQPNIKFRRNIYLIFKELVNNVAKHSRAANCYVSLALARNHLQLTVTDDGVGFDLEKRVVENDGVDNIRERVEVLNGTMNIKTNPLEGSIVVVNIPV